MRRLLGLFFGIHLLGSTMLFAQENTQPVRVSDFRAVSEGDGYRFVPQLPPLQQKAGAPQAHWKCYWEFGDGSFSFEESPLHRYARQGDYYALFSATAHYDDGKLPDKNGKGIFASVPASKDVPLREMPDVFDTSRAVIRLKTNRLPRAGEELALIMSYRNLGRLTTDGQLFLFFNEKKFPDSHFRYDTARTHFGEKADPLYSVAPPVGPVFDWVQVSQSTISSVGASGGYAPDVPTSTIINEMLANARGTYRDERGWRFTDLQPGEKRNLFVGLSGTEKMLKDTSAFIHIEAVFAPFDPMIAPARYVLEIEIVSSHDPNAIAVSDNRVNYRIVKDKHLDYKVRFQNNGEGPASTVKVEVKIPKGLNLGKMRPLDWYPKCPICPKTPDTRSCLDTSFVDNKLVFTFRNIYLPGSSQKGVTEYDSTQGFIKYRIEPERDMPKRPFSSRAEIVFDKNPPIFTNYSRTRFKMGLSPGLKIGYGFHPDSLRQGYFLMGASLSPYKSWRIYPQIELLTGISGKEDLPEVTQSTLMMTAQNNGIALRDSVLADTLLRGSRNRITFEMPLLLRKDISRVFGLGLGGSVRMELENGSIQTEAYRTTIDWGFTDGPTGFVLTRDVTQTEIQKSSGSYRNTRFRYTAFLDMTIGSVRIGPHLGLRAGIDLGNKQPFVQVSAGMKL